MYIPKGILAWFCLIGCVAGNLFGFMMAALSLRQLQGSGMAGYRLLFTSGLLMWTALGIGTAGYLLYSARTPGNTYSFDHLGLSYVGKSLVFVIVLASVSCFLTYRSMAKPNVLEVRSFLLCFVLSFLFAAILPITIQNAYLWFVRLPDLWSRRKTSKARLLVRWTAATRSVGFCKVNSLGFSSDGTTLISSAEDGAVRFWHLNGTPAREPLQIKSRDALSESTESALSPDGSRIATTNSHSVRMWDLHSGAMKWEYHDPDYSPDVIAFSHDSNCLA